MAGDSKHKAEFRWQSFFQRAREPFFLLNRHARFLFVNRAWENATGLSARDVLGLTCHRRSALPTDPPDLMIRFACCPPREVLQGQARRVRRSVPLGGGRQWWDIDFLPLHSAGGRMRILGRILVPTEPPAPAVLPLPQALALLREGLAAKLPEDQQERLWKPEKLVALRERVMQRHGLEHLASNLPAVQRLAAQVRLAGQTRVAVLILGEHGTGKEWTARAIHFQSEARERPFLALDCARLPAPALAEILAAGGGLRWRPHLGTVYLKEPQRLPRDLQLALLALLADAEGPRLLAGCSVDPVEAIARGRLLPEFHGGLATLVLECPPLRERRADLPQLVAQFLERANEDGERKITGLSEDAWEVVRSYRWPGNLRELGSVLAAARRRAASDQVAAADLPATVRLAVGLGPAPATAAEKALPLNELLEEAERRLIQLALRGARGNKARAAERLGISRPRLLRRIEILGIRTEE